MDILDAAATAARLPYALLLPAIRAAALELRAGRINAPTRTALPLPDGGTYLVMPGCDGRFAVTKLVAVVPANRQRGLPAILGQVAVADAATGRPLCVFDGPTVTARRTAAVTMLGVETLAETVPRRVVLVGTGAQAAAHAEAIAERWQPECLRVVARDPLKARQFAEKLAASGIAVTAAALEQACADADCIITLTNARQPVLPETIRPGTMVVGTGAFRPEMAELPPGLLRSRTVVVDDLAGAHEEAGDLLQAGLDWSRVRGLGDWLAEPPAGPVGPVVFKTVGHAAWDMAAVRTALAD